MIGFVHLISILGYLWCAGSGVLSRETCDPSCHPTHPDKINIHLIAHSHNDYGWLKTPEQYFYGSNKMHSPVGVQYILDSVISELEKNPDRRFVYGETGYLWSWWQELSDSDRRLVQKLVNEGRLEISHGGWCMSDQATVHYSAMIDQMTFGLQFLNETFGACGRPTVSWQIDPFGHSSEVAIEFAEMGFNGVFLGRIDYNEFDERNKTQSLEMVWRPDPSGGQARELFASVLYNLYSAPGGFCFDAACSDEPIMDNKKLHGYNVDDKIKRFADQMKQYKVAYKTRHVMVPMGGDFSYTVASSWFRNMERLIKYMNGGNFTTEFHVLYSTPACYLKALHDENVEWPVKEENDFYPYSSDKHSYWTGFFTSRPTFKYYISLGNSVLQATKQIATLLGTQFSEAESDFKRTMATLQNHDAITGTQKQHVVEDLSLYLAEGIDVGLQIFSTVYKKLFGSEYPEQVFGNLRNISQLKLSEDHDNFLITIYNPLSHKKRTFVKFPFVKDFPYEVLNRFGARVPVDYIPLPPNLSRVPGRHSNATHDLVFVAEDLPAMGFASFYVRAVQAFPAGYDEPHSIDQVINDAVVVLTNKKVQINFNKKSGLLMSFTKDNVTVPLTQNFYGYRPTKGFNYDADHRASGAYIFRPQSQKARMEFPNASITEYTGRNVFEIHQKFSPWLSQVVRLYKDSEDVEFEWLVGPLPQNEDWTGMEIVTRYSTNIASNSVFYTDSNGRRWIKRTRKKLADEPVSSNYYPLTTSIAIKDGNRQMTVITDRPEGGTSLQDGEVEIMIHRRLTYDDGRGVSEPLDEMMYGEGLVVRGKHIVQLNDVAAAVDPHRFLAIEAAYQPLPSFAKTSLDPQGWLNKFNISFSLLSAELPPSIHVLTLERVESNKVLLRLENIFEPNEKSVHAKAETIDLKTLFSRLAVIEVRELTLGANLEKEKMQRWKWRASGQTTRNYDADPSNVKVIIHPMQIRTFLLSVALDGI